MTTNKDELREQQKQQWGAASVGWEKWDDWFDRMPFQTDLSTWICDTAKLRPGHRVLDLACGTGYPAVSAAERVRPGGSVVATDLTSEMVAATRRKAAKLGLDNLEVREMDAENIDYPDASFDAVTMRFGLMFCPDPVRAVAEVRRVLRPGHRAVFVVWDEPSKNPFFTTIGQVVAQFVPMPPPDPSLPGVFRLAPPGELKRVMQAGGLDDVAVESRETEMTYRSLDEYWQIQTDLAAPLKAAIATLGSDDVARLKQAAIEAARAFARPDGTVVFRATALGGVGVKR
jgi:ubiquinone/menaquinone biosynthesis C-methylase UbiE